MTKKKSLFQRINEQFSDTPIAEGPNVFNCEDYAKAVGIAESTALRRIKKMVLSGEVRKVKTRRGGTTVSAFEYIGD